MCSGDAFKEHNAMMHFVFTVFLHLGINGLSEMWLQESNVNTYNNAGYHMVNTGNYRKNKMGWWRGSQYKRFASSQT